MTVDLLRSLRVRGRLSAQELAAAVGGSRATLMRAVQALGDAVVVRGKARRTTYAARRALRGATETLPLYRVDRLGDVREIARLHLTYPRYSCAVEFLEDFGWPLDESMGDGWFDGLPYPLYDMRPQGFLGRHFARHNAEMLQVPASPEDWTDDDVLHALALLGEDVPGDLVVGEVSCRRWLDSVARVRSGELPPLIADEAVEPEYLRLAAASMATGVLGSSAGGEFPKFTALRGQGPDSRPCHVLVKFSGSDGSEVTQRWSDLLVCEHLALSVLDKELDVPAASSTVVTAGGRTFLEVRRFDRHGLLGRSGVVSWATLNSALFGVSPKPWAEVARLLSTRGLLGGVDAARLERLAHFGQLIANSDMHDGNLSFVPATPGVALAPAYDMLPMLYAPLRGVELPTREYAPKLALPSERTAWEAAAHAALRFWELAASDTRLSQGFRHICASNARKLHQLIAV